MDPSSEGSVTRINSYLTQGKVADLSQDGVLIGSQLASYYGYKPGDTLTIISPASGIAGSGWRYKFKVAGIYTSGMYDYDMNLILVTLTHSKTGHGFLSPVGYRRRRGAGAIWHR